MQKLLSDMGLTEEDKNAMAIGLEKLRKLLSDMGLADEATTMANALEKVQKQLSEMVLAGEAATMADALEKVETLLSGMGAEIDRREKADTYHWLLRGRNARKKYLTDLAEYLFDCHFDLYTNIDIPKELFAGVESEPANGIYYPRELRPWTSSMKSDQHRHFQDIIRWSGQWRVFPKWKDTKKMVKHPFGLPGYLRHPPCYAQGNYLQDPANSVLNLARAMASLDYPNDVPDNIYCSSVERMAPRDMKQPEKLSSLGVRYNKETIQNILVYRFEPVIEDVALYLKRIVKKWDLFSAALEVFNNGGSDMPEPRCELRVALAIARVYDSMVRYGLAYGFVTSCEYLLFLCIDRAHPEIVYCRPCVPQEDVGELLDDRNPEALYHTAVAQLASFCLLSNESEGLNGERLSKWLKKAEVTLAKWPQPYTAPLESSLEYEPPMPSPTRPYCTQACIWGLKCGLALDKSCPNVHLHRGFSGNGHHGIGMHEFVRLMQEQLDESPYRYCEGLDFSHGTLPHVGRFKLELAPYGYTIYGAGSSASQLKDEVNTYQRLSALQGEVIPVYCGIVHSDEGYVIPGAEYIHDIMLLSWPGEKATVALAGGLSEEVLEAEAAQASTAAGVEYKSKYSEYHKWVYWDSARGRAMLMGFKCVPVSPNKPSDRNVADQDTHKLAGQDAHKLVEQDTHNAAEQGSHNAAEQGSHKVSKHDSHKVAKQGGHKVARKDRRKARKLSRLPSLDA